ncbi:MAG: Ig-like domain-containing protein [Anaerolineae bacterium]|nr:Ig-like domain-containing protein [Gemmatimonadaceae bacterium]
MRATTASLVLFLAACTDATAPNHPLERPSLGYNAAGTTRVTVDPGTVARHPGDTVRIKVEVTNNTGTLLPSQNVTWVTSNPTVATVSALGTIRAHGVGTTTVFARRDGAEDTVTVNVFLPGVGIRPLPGHFTRVGAGRNEPAGYTAVADRPFKTRAFTRTDFAAAEWWEANTEYNRSQLSIVSDLTGPISPGTVAQIRYPTGMVGGTAPVGIGLLLQPNPSAVYMSTAVRISSNFYGHPTSGVNKLAFFYMANNTTSAYFSAQGLGMGPLQPQLRLQSVPQVALNLGPNLLPGVTLARGVWHKLEFLLVANTSGQPNGQAHLWLNGTKIMDHRNIIYLAAGETAFNAVSITSIWGGGNTVKVPYDMYTWWDHAYVSTP